MTIELDKAGLEAAIRECARITAPNVTEEIFAKERDADSERYQNTKSEIAQVIRAYLEATHPPAPQGDLGALIAEWRASMEGVTPGPWFEGDGWIFIPPVEAYVNPTHALRNILRDVDKDEVQANVGYIARCSPDNIGKLLDALTTLSAKLQAAEAQLAEANKALDRLTAWVSDEYDDVPNVVSVALVFDNGEEITAMPFGDFRAARRARSLAGGEHG